VTATAGTFPEARRAYVGAGSNIEPERHLGTAVRSLRQMFGDLELSSVYRTTAVGFDGDDFLNIVVSFSTALPPERLVVALDRIEAAAGRRRGQERFSSRSLDLDLLMYADQVVDEPGLRLPRADIIEYAFVLAPLAELAPDLVHPVEGATMAELWSRFATGDQSITRLAESPL